MNAVVEEQAVDRFDQAKQLVKYAGGQLSHVRELTEECLRDREIKAPLLIEIKNYMENLRSALEYCAHGLFDKYGVSPKADPRIYFPYAPLNQTLDDFRRQKTIDKIPGLATNRPDIVTRIESYQHFGPHGNHLPIFMELNNENKHQMLTPQVESDCWSLEFQFTIPPGGSVEIPTEPELLAEFAKQYARKLMTWRGFLFQTNEVMVWPFLVTSGRMMGMIVDELAAM